MDKKYSEGKFTQVSEEIRLKPIFLENHHELYTLMKRIYPPAYIDYWKDDGEWYVNDLYNIDNLKKELKEENTEYFFVFLKKTVIGIMRIVYGVDTNYQKDSSYIKLHRLYLDQTIQNKGIGYKLMKWLIESSREKGYKKLWLEVMDKQHQALHFYRKLGFVEVDKVYIPFELIFDEYRGMFKSVKEL